MAVLKEVVLTLPMTPDLDVAACEKAEAVARSMSMSLDKIDEIKMAVIEACLNAVEHSHAKQREIEMIFSVLGEGEPERLQIAVSDHGEGFDVDNATPRRKKDGLKKRGWGLQIIEGLMDEVRIESTERGTTVVMSKEVRQK